HASQECYTALVNVTVQEPGRGSPFYIHIHRGRYELAQGRGLADHLGCDPQTRFFVPPNIKPWPVTGDIIVVMITELWGNDILSYLEKNISKNFSHDFVVVESISFIVLMIISSRCFGDAAKKETDPDFDHCAVCIESYKQNDIVRILPCKHVFYKSCVDPWLSEHCTCTMCKLHILKALGIMSLLPQDGEHTPRAREINIT
ncbi:hypothetical protein FD755_000892, partial [Muntiacus reevesi]